MSRLPLPRVLVRPALALVHRLRLAWWRWRRASVRGCLVAAFDPQGQVLLVRHSYHRRDTWMLPGGGLSHNEDPVSAGVRELREETGCTLNDATHRGTQVVDRNGWTNRLELVHGTTRDTPRADGREIMAAAFFNVQALPADTSATTRTVLAHLASER